MYPIKFYFNGETVKLNYELEKNVIEPKVDLRFILDIIDTEEFDLRARLPSSTRKLSDDEGKLVKEGKYVAINRLHEVLVNTIEGLIVQIAG